MQNRMYWVMGTLAAAATLAAIGVSLAGYRGELAQRSSAPAPSAASGNPQDADPLAPRLFDQSGSVRIHVAGAVRRPGVYTLPAWSRVIDAVKKAGGATSQADLDGINLADRLRDAEQLRIPFRGRASRLTAHRPVPEPPPVSRTSGGHGEGRYPFRQAVLAAGEGAAEPGPSAGEPVNLNTSSRQELESLPGIGPATAERIVAYRESEGPFLRPEDLMNVRGIGPTRFARLRPLVSAP